MLEPPLSAVRLVAPAAVAEVLGVSIDEVVSLVEQGMLAGARVGAPARLRIEEQSVADYLAAQVELERRMALWRQSGEASFPELWGTGVIRHSD